MLSMKREELAQAASVAVATLADFETGRRTPHPRTLEAIQTALEAAGVEFIPENGGGAGVRLKKAAEAHDTGKGQPVWQDALRAGAEPATPAPSAWQPPPPAPKRHVWEEGAGHPRGIDLNKVDD